MAFRTGNPVLRAKTFELPPAIDAEGAMSLQGTVNKSFLLLLIALATASLPWSAYASAGAEAPLGPYALGGGLGGFVVALVVTFKQRWAPLLAPVYAGLQGLLLGALSALFESRFPGIVMQAVGLTFGVFFCLLAAYSSRLIRATENFKLGVVAATGGIFVVYLVTMLARLFGSGLPYIHDSGLVGIGFSVLVVLVAAANLVLDFDFIESGVARRAPRYMEWYAAFGLIVTLFWLYLEILRLLSKARQR
jgi:uncharacterized YccA/Bax inhibitor family protein